MTTITATPPHATTLPLPAAEHWVTRLFATPSRAASAGAGAQVGARAAYQAALYGRARLVDTRPADQRAREGYIHPDLIVATVDELIAEGLDRLAGPVPVYVVGPAAFSGIEARVLVVEGGFDAWRQAGLPYQHAGSLAA